MKKGIAMLGLVGAMMSSAFKGSDRFEISSVKPNSPTSKNKAPKKPKLRNCQPSEYFGERSNIVLAITKTGEKKNMKLKNALKHGFAFQYKGILQNAI